MSQASTNLLNSAMPATTVAPSTCIYCGQVRPFTDEHVFPAGLGGDDRRYLLKNLVCGHCNTQVFSKLEASFMRASPVAIARIFLQSRGRGKGKKASIPTIDTRTTTVIFDEVGPVEAEVLAEGKPVALMQILFLGDGKIHFVGGDQAGVVEFLDALDTAIMKTLFSSGSTQLQEMWIITTQHFSGKKTPTKSSHRKRLLSH